MGEIWVKQFTGGLDARRLPETTPGGVLIRASDGHITRGGEFEQRQAFVPAYSLPIGTVGLAATATSLVVFGSGVAPMLPEGVLYQRLQHPDGLALARVLSWDLFSGKIYVVGEFADGSICHFYDGARVTDWSDGRARTSFSVATVSSGASVTALTVAGVSLIGGAVALSGSVIDAATEIASAINSYISTPRYIATSVGSQVNVVAYDAGTAANGRSVVVTTSGSVTLTGAPATMAGGAASGATYTPGDFVKTIGTKVYAIETSALHFSGISAPTGWTTGTTGAGFVDMASYASGAEQLFAVVKYQSNIAVFAESVTQIWYVDPDPTNNKQTQELSNTGTSCGHSVTQFGDTDIFYLHESGLRSLRARLYSTAATTTDIGSPVDPLITAHLQTLTTEDRQKVYGLINPVDGRFWLVMKDRVFVFSYFPNAKVSAWTQYLLTTPETPFDCDYAIATRRKVFVRSGDVIYAYGGLGSAPVYDETQPEVWLPLVDGGSPARQKEWQGIDAALKGLWEIRANFDPTNSDAYDTIARVSVTTFSGPNIDAVGQSTHIGLRLIGIGAAGSTPLVLSSIMVHYGGDQIED